VINFFRDTAGREWNLAPLTFDDLREIRRTFGVDMLNGNRIELSRLTSDREQVANVVWLLISRTRQPEFHNVEAAEFFDHLDGDTVVAAAEAFMQAYTAFLPEKRETGGAKPAESVDHWQDAISAAAVAGVDLWPLNYRELVTAVEAKQVNDWNHTAAIRMDILNSTYGRRRAVEFRKLHPFAKAFDSRSKRRLSKKASATMLDSIFGAGQ
jgi:hypothetical protein